MLHVPVNECHDPGINQTREVRKIMCPTVLNSSVKSEIISESLDIDKTVPRYVVHESMKGRLGNQLFQTAAAFGIAASLRYIVYIDVSNPLVPYFELSPSRRINLTNKIRLNEEECVDKVWRCRKDIYSHNITIEGYLQSWKHFTHINQTIRQVFTIRSQYRYKVELFLNSIDITNRTLIGIHVRRGDIADAKCSGYTMATTGYFRKAMELYRTEFKNAIFVVVSDSIEWCKDNLVADDVIYSKFTEPITDLALMSMCHHMIVSGGTFGFWGAWLAGGKVIYPKGWPRPGSWLDVYGMVVEDFWLPGWVGLD